MNTTPREEKSKPVKSSLGCLFTVLAFLALLALGNYFLLNWFGAALDEGRPELEQSIEK